MTLDEQRKWIRQSQKGDQNAFSRLYDTHVRKIYDYIYFKTYHKETAEDLTSITFMKALEALDGFDAETGSFPAWLYSVARNAVIDFYRTRRSSIALDDVWDLAAETDVEMDACNREQYKLIHDALSSLPSEKRDLVILRLWQDLSFAEIAEIRGETEGQCKMSFYRLIDKLRKELPAALFLLLILAKHVIP